MGKDVANHLLLERILGLDLDSCDAELSFSKRLARDNDWTQKYTERVLIEYKRFLFLAISQSESVTPSDEVDQAWHLHMLYSRHYWGELCQDTLRTSLHHGPTAGGAAEQKRYREQYERTLLLYQEVFGERPPADIWPNSYDRFANVEHYRRVDTSQYLVLNRNDAIFSAGCLFLLLLVGFLVGENWGALKKLGFVGIVMLLGVSFLIRKNSSKRGYGKKSGGAGCDTGCGGCGGCGG